MSWVLPSFIRVQIADGTQRRPGLWIPVFLLWPLWFLVLLTSLAVLLAMSARSRASTPAFRATCGLHLLACAFRGGQCEIRANGRELVLSIV